MDLSMVRSVLQANSSVMLGCMKEKSMLEW
jgi:hypothetical protein